MANTRRITEVLQQIGYEPQEGKTIVVSYAPENLSDAIRKIFILNNFYALSFCKEQLVLIPYRHFWADVKKEVRTGSCRTLLSSAWRCGRQESTTASTSSLRMK